MQVRRRRRRTAAILNSRPPSQQAGSRPGEKAEEAENKLLEHRRKTAAILAPGTPRQEKQHPAREISSQPLEKGTGDGRREAGDGLGPIWSRPAKVPGPDEGNKREF